jgi:hypothetical protein
MFLTDAPDDGDYRYRLVGTGLVRAMGYDMTGQRVASAYAGPDWDALRQDYVYVAGQGRPCLTINDVTLRMTELRYAYARLLMPLASDGRRVDMILGNWVEIDQATADRTSASAR